MANIIEDYKLACIMYRRMLDYEHAYSNKKKRKHLRMVNGRINWVERMRSSSIPRKYFSICKDYVKIKKTYDIDLFCIYKKEQWKKYRKFTKDREKIVLYAACGLKHSVKSDFRMTYKWFNTYCVIHVPEEFKLKYIYTIMREQNRRTFRQESYTITYCYNINRIYLSKRDFSKKSCNFYSILPHCNDISMNEHFAIFRDIMIRKFEEVKRYPYSILSKDVGIVGDLASIIRYPYVIPSFARSLYYQNFHPGGEKYIDMTAYIVKMLKRGGSDFYQKFFEYVPVPDCFKKYVMRSFKFYTAYEQLCVYVDNNNILDIFRHINLEAFTYASCESIFERGHLIIKAGFGLKKMINIYKKLFIDDKLESSKLVSLLNDTYYLYDALIALNVVVDTSKYSNLQSMHDDLSRINNKLMHPNVVFQYKDPYVNFEHEGCIVLRPVDSDCLYDVGLALNNCVGSYAERVSSFKTSIYYIKYNDKVEACLQVSDGKLVQAKINFNDRPAKDSDIYNCIVLFCQHMQFEYNSCHDM